MADDLQSANIQQSCICLCFHWVKTFWKSAGMLNLVQSLASSFRRLLSFKGIRPRARPSGWKLNGRGLIIPAVAYAVLLFVLYTVDLISLIESHDLSAHLYADDTQVHGLCRPAGVALNFSVFLSNLEAALLPRKYWLIGWLILLMFTRQWMRVVCLDQFLGDIALTDEDVELVRQRHWRHQTTTTFTTTTTTATPHASRQTDANTVGYQRRPHRRHRSGWSQVRKIGSKKNCFWILKFLKKIHKCTFGCLGFDIFCNLRHSSSWISYFNRSSCIWRHIIQSTKKRRDMEIGERWVECPSLVLKIRVASSCTLNPKHLKTWKPDKVKTVFP